MMHLGQLIILPSCIIFYHKAIRVRTEVVTMNMQVVKWFIDLAMGISFLVSFVTGFFKFTLLMRMIGLVDLVLPLALMSDIHDWSGLVLGFFVAAHLVSNRAWIMSMTKKIFFSEKKMH